MAVGDFNYTAPPTISKFMRSDAEFRVAMGPVGSGKSAGCTAELFRRAIEMPPGPDGIRRSRFAIIRNTNQQLKDTTMKTVFDWVTPGVFGKWVATDNKLIVKFKDVESEWLFRPLDKPEDVQRVLSLELTGAWLNEAREIPVEIVQAVQGRLGRYPAKKKVKKYFAFLIADTNPPEIDSDWFKIIEHLPLEDDDENSVMLCDSFKQPSGLSPEAENIENLRDEYYPKLAKGKTKAWIDQYVHGLYAPSLKGKPVYIKSFKEDRHVRPHDVSPAADLPIIVGLDFARKPAAVYMQMEMMGRINFLRESVDFDIGFKEFIRLHIKPTLRNYFPTNPVIFVGDPSGVKRNDTDDNSCILELRKFSQDYENYFVKTAYTNDPDVRIQALETILMDFPGGDPNFQINPCCKWVIQGLRSKYFYELDRKDQLESKATPKKNRWSHVVEAAQYGVMFLNSPKYDHTAFMQPTLSNGHPMFSKRAVPSGIRPAQSEGY